MQRTRIISGLASGLLFGAGLAIAGMTNPNKVLNFLDLSGAWDPSLALVMIAAIPVSAFAFRLARRRRRPWFDESFVLPGTTRLEASLVIGSALFGLGWGLGGYCPGPAIASLGHPGPGLIGFLIAMLLGLLVVAPLARKLFTRAALAKLDASAPLER